MEELPRTPGAANTAEMPGRSEDYEEPQGELEHGIVQLWRETFHLEQISRNDNFFALGGNSLIAMELMDKVSARLDVQLPVVALFQNPTPRQMAECINALEYATDADPSL